MKKLIFACLCSTVVLTMQKTKAQENPNPLLEVKQLFKKLMSVEDAHDLKAVRAMLWESPSMLFVSKKPKEEGWYGGYWGTDQTMAHFTDLYSHTFTLAPDYPREKEVLLAPDVVETYVPVTLTAVFEDGKPAEPRHFILIMEWVKKGRTWKLATDIALPIPKT